jgi:hypothetical protein
MCFSNGSCRFLSVAATGSNDILKPAGHLVGYQTIGMRKPKVTPASFSSRHP